MDRAFAQAGGRGVIRIAGPRDGAGRIATAIAAFGLLAACDPVGPNFTTPTTPVVEAWLDANTSASGGAGGLTARSAPVVQWWGTFNDPVLNDLVARAYAQNLTLQAAGARVLQARAELGIAFGEFYPQSQVAGGSLSQTRISENLGPIRDAQRILDIDPTFQTTELGFDAQWELDVWGNQTRLLQSAEANLAATIADYDDVLVTLTGDVAALYIDIRALEEALAIARQNIALQQEAADLAQVRFDNGVTTELDVQESLALLSDTQALVPELEADLAQSRYALAALLGVPPANIAALLGGPRGIPSPPASVAVGIPVELLRRRPDIRAAEMEAAAQSAQIGIALADLYPQFILQGAIGVQASAGSPLLSSASQTGLGSAGFVWPIFNYGRIQNNVRAQDAEFQALVARYQNTVISAYNEVEGAMVAYRKAREAVGFYRKAVEASEAASEIALQQYSDGVVDYSRVLNTQTQLLRSQSDLVSARAQVSTSLVALYKGLGGGWQIRQNQEFLPGTVLAEMAYRTDWGDLLETTPTNMRLR